jgi:uncharacterized membrane protein affecting hemolysin expression
MNKATGLYLTESDGSILKKANYEEKKTRLVHNHSFQNLRNKKALEIEKSGTNNNIHQI